METAGILEIADVIVCNKADHPGDNELVRDLSDIASTRPIFETVATRSQGVAELFDGLVPGAHSRWQCSDFACCCAIFPERVQRALRIDGLCSTERVGGADAALESGERLDRLPARPTPAAEMRHDHVARRGEPSVIGLECGHEPA